jgi:hypothetical protein
MNDLTFRIEFNFKVSKQQYFYALSLIMDII